MSQFFTTSSAAPAPAGSIIQITTDDTNIVSPDGGGNVNFTGTHGILTTGAVANSFNAAIANTITLGDLAPIAPLSPSLTLTTGDLNITAGDINITAGNLNLVSSTARVNLGGNLLIHDSSSDDTSIFVGKDSGNLSATGTDNAALGNLALDSVTTGSRNTAIGSSTMPYLLGGSNNTAVGYGALQDATTANNNVGLGTAALKEVTGGQYNIAIGSGEIAPTVFGAGYNLLTGQNNILIGGGTGVAGTGAGHNYTGAESNNICLGNATVGTLGESNVMRLGTTGAGAGQVSTTFLAGIYGITPAIASPQPVVMDSAGQMGTQAQLTVSQGGTGASTFTAYAVLCGGTTATNPIQPIASVGSAGQVLTSNGAGTLPTFQASGAGGIVFSVITAASKSMISDEGYFANNAGTITFTLPATASVGDKFAVYGMNNNNGWTIAQNAGQTIHFGNRNTTTGVGGSISSIRRYDGLLFVCNVANTDFVVIQSIGNMLVV